MLIVIKNKAVLNTPYLWRMVLKLIYDGNQVSLEEEKRIMESIVAWKNHLDLRKDCGETNAVDEENMEILSRCAWMLREDQSGNFDNRKRLFKEYRIDYRKFHRLPEAYTLADLTNAAKMKEAYDAKNPEQETYGNKTLRG